MEKTANKFTKFMDIASFFSVVLSVVSSVSGGLQVVTVSLRENVIA